MTRTGSLSVLVLAAAVAALGVSFAQAQEASPARRGGDDAGQRESLVESIVAQREEALQRELGLKERERLSRALASVSLADLQQLAADPRRVAELNALGDAGQQLLYTPIAPCRIVDTRIAGGPLAMGSTRDFKVVGGGHAAQGGSVAGCGVPAGPTSAVLNIVAVEATGPGNLRAWAYSTPPVGPPSASVLNFAFVPGSGLNIANGLPVPICDPSATTCPFDVRVYVGGPATTQTQVVIDVVGYFEAFPAAPGASATSNASQSIPDATETIITFNTETHDNDSIVDLGTSTSRFTIHTAGTYLLAGAIPWSSSATGRRSIFFKVNGGSYRGYQTDVPFAGDTTWQNMSFVTRLAVGDYVELFGYQTSGSPIQTDAFPGIAPTLSVQWLGQ